MGDWTVQGVIYSATNISSWTANPVQPASPNVVYGNGVFVGNDGADLYVSTDGLTFTPLPM